MQPRALGKCLTQAHHWLLLRSLGRGEHICFTIAARFLSARNWEEKRVNRDTLNRGKGREWHQHRIRERTHTWTEERSGNEGHKRATAEITRLGRSRMWQEAIAVFAEIQDPDAVCTTAALDACAKSLRLHAASKIFEEMPKKTVSAYNVIIGLLGRLRRVDDAERVLFEMQQHGLAPNIITYTSIVDGYGMVQDANAVSDVLRRVREVGLPESQVFLGAAIAACAKAGHTKLVEELLQKITAKGWKPDIRMMTSVMKSYVINGDEAGASKIFSDMRQCGTQLDVVAYTVLLSSASGKDALPKAEKFWAEMLADGVQPDIFAYNALLEAALQSAAFGRFQHILTEMESSGIPWSSDTQHIIGRASELQDASELPSGWHKTLDPASGQFYYWMEADPAATTTWMHPSNGSTAQGVF